MRCGRPIVFVCNILAKPRRDEHGQLVETFIPVEPVPDSEGNVCAMRDDRGRLIGWPVSRENPPRPPGRLYMPHPAICPVQPGPAGTEPRRDDPQLPLQFDTDSEADEPENSDEIAHEFWEEMQQRYTR